MRTDKQKEKKKQLNLYVVKRLLWYKHSSQHSHTVCLNSHRAKGTAVMLIPFWHLWQGGTACWTAHVSVEKTNKQRHVTMLLPSLTTIKVPWEKLILPAIQFTTSIMFFCANNLPFNILFWNSLSLEVCKKIILLVILVWFVITVL